MNPAGNTSGKSWNNNLRLPLNRQGMLADLRLSSPGPPRVAAVAHQPLERSERLLFAMRPATPGGDAAVPPTGLGQEHPPVGESPGPVWATRQIGATFLGEALETPSGGENANPMDSVANRLLSDDYEAYDPEDPNVRALMADYEAMILDTDALPFGEALDAPSGGENANPMDLIANRLLSDDYEAYDPEDPNVRALMADYGATILDTDALPFGEALDASSGGENANPMDSVANRLLSDDYEAYDPEDPNVRALMADYEAAILDTEALPFGEALDAPSGQAIMASGGESADLFDLVVNRLMSDDYEAYDPEDPNVRALMADYEATFLDTGAAPSGEAFEAPSGQTIMASGGERAKRPAEPSVHPDHARGKRRARDDYMLLTSEQRQSISQIFRADSKRSNRSIADEFGVSYSTIRQLKKKFRKTGGIQPKEHANRLSGDQRRAILHIFETDPERSSQSIVDEFGVAYSTIKLLRKKFYKTGDIQPGEHANRLSGDQRRTILHIFETDPKRSSQSIMDEFGVGFSTIQLLRKKFYKTGDIQPGDHAKRLTDDELRAILHIFETDPERSNQSLADEFGVVEKTIRVLKRKFEKTGNIKVRDHKKRLTGGQRRAILQIFETDPKRSIQSIADDFGVSTFSITILKRKFEKTGNIKEGNHGNRLTDDQRRAILHIFETDPERSNQSIAEEFGVAYSTILKLRKKFRKQAI